MTRRIIIAALVTIAALAGLWLAGMAATIAAALIHHHHSTEDKEQQT